MAELELELEQLIVQDGPQVNQIPDFDNQDSADARWYYWHPIHFASCSANTDRLRSVINTLADISKVNSLSIFSENALHVLLNYGRPQRMFNVQLSNGWESTIYDVVAEEENEVINCATLLIDAGIDVNHNNIWNETPLTIAIKFRLLKVIELILKTKNVDHLDTWKDSSTGKSARDLLREYGICLEMLTTNYKSASPEKVLFTYLKAEEEELFLRYSNGNITQYVNKLDGAHDGNIGWTMLQLCLIKGYLTYEKKATYQDREEADVMKMPMFKIFCKNGFGRSIEHLLNNNAEFSLSVIQMATKLSYYPFLTIILEHRNTTINEENILNILSTLDEMFLVSENFNTKYVLFLLMSKLERFHQHFDGQQINIHRRRILNSILDMYLRNKGSNNEYKENICQVLRLGASLASQSLKQICCDTLHAHLDECIRSTKSICYDSLIQDVENNYSETETLHFLSHDYKKFDLLNHPALVYLIHIKWKKTKVFFYSNIIFYFLFLIALYAYMIQHHIGNINKSLFIVFLVFLSILTLKEFVQFCLNYRKYLYDVSNYLELFILGCCFINVYIKGEMSMILAILLSTLIFLLMLGQLPGCTKYMIVFSSTKYFLEYSFFYSIQFLSFAICFFILLPFDESEDSNTWAKVITKLFDTLLFFIVQFEGDITDPPGFPIFGRFIVAIFIFCMTLILNSLLVGLIVTDMDDIHKTSKHVRQIKIIRSIRKIESFLKATNNFFCRMPLVSHFSDINVFSEEQRNQHKILGNINDFEEIFDDHDREEMKKILENRLKQENVLNHLYEYILTEIYSDKSNQDNRNILLTLSRLEEQLRRDRSC